MTWQGTQLVAAAEALVGTRFRFGGRDPAGGLDCIGLVVAALEAIGRRVPALPGYTLRQHELAGFFALARGSGLEPIEGNVETGDVLLLRPSPAQWHLAIQRPGGGIVHAHAELRRVVTTPAPLPWPVARRWRLA